MIEFQKIQC